MEPRIQQASEEMLELLGEDGLEITWWTRPHRGWGWVKSLFVFVEDDDEEDGGVIVVGEWQSLEHRRGGEPIGVDDSLDHVREDVDVGSIPPILDLLTSTTLPWGRATAPAFTGASLNGMRVEWGGLETERRWSGRLEHVDDVTARLWRLVDPLVPHGDHPLD